MSLLEEMFADRTAEIELYLDLLQGLEENVQGAADPQSNGVAMSPEQQRILFSGTYLQLYNLVEATANECIKAVCSAIKGSSECRPARLSTPLKREWVRYCARTHSDLNFDNRLTHSVETIDHIISGLPINDIRIEVGGGGNWDDEEIFRLARRLDIRLQISAPTNAAIKRTYRDERTALGFIKSCRNKLAHGEISFGDCERDVSVRQLRDLVVAVLVYLKEVIAAFIRFIDEKQFLQPEVTI